MAYIKRLVFATPYISIVTCPAIWSIKRPINASELLKYGSIIVAGIHSLYPVSDGWYSAKSLTAQEERLTTSP